MLTYNNTTKVWEPKTLTLAAGAGIAVSGTTITNSKPDQTVILTNGTGISVTGTYPNFTISSTAASSSIPAGTIVAYGGDTTKIPSGWLLCNGLTVSRTTYSALLGAIGINWGSGDGVNTFNLPDLRGQFLRGASLKTGNDPDVATRTGGGSVDKVGSRQEDAFQAFGLCVKASQGGLISGGVGFDGGVAGCQSLLINNFTERDGNGTPRTTKETRPKNVYVNYIIKY